MTKSNGVLGNSIWAIIQQIVSIIVSFVIGIIATRFLGPDRSGVIGVANSLILIISSLSWLGIDSIIVNEMIKDEKKETEVVWTALITKILTFIVLLIAGLFVTFFVYKDDERMLHVFIIVGVGGVFQCYEAFAYWFQRKLLVKFVAIGAIIAQLICFGYQVYIIVNNKSIYWFAAVSLINNIALFIFLLVVFILFVRVGPVFRWSILKKLLKRSYHYIISALAITLYMQIDKVMIGKMISNSQAGIYNVAVNIAVIWQFVPMAVINSFRPVILERRNNNDPGYIDILKALNLLITTISVLFCLLLSLFSRWGVVFLYGEEFADAAAPLSITVWATMISMLGVVRGIWFVAEDYNKYDKYFTVIAAVINIILNVVFIKKLGIAGAAIATVVSYFTEVFLVLPMFKGTSKYLSIFLSSFVEWKKNIQIIKKVLFERKHE